MQRNLHPLKLAVVVAAASVTGLIIGIYTNARGASPVTAAVSIAPALNVGPLPPPQIAPPLNRTRPTNLTVELEAKEVSAQLADGVTNTYWTYGGTVPGPMVRVLQGDTVDLKLTNASDSQFPHSIDLHAVTGPGGGAAATQLVAGKDSIFQFKALNPGVYVYHCATAMIPHHIASGMYGLIVVEPPEGLPKVDREFYVMQGELYLQGAAPEPGHRAFDVQKLRNETPDYVFFNGRPGALTGDGALKATVGESVRIFFGVGGPNLISSFHVIGEIFDKVYPEGASEPASNVQTTLVPAGGATIVEFKVDYPGRYLLVDHSLSRLEKGAVGFLEVEGPANAEIFHAASAPDGATGH